VPLHITPAMAAGVTDHAWGVADIVAIGGSLQSEARTKSERHPNQWNAHMVRYVVRRQENREYCVWDTKTDKPTEADGRCYINLQFDEALDHAQWLNRAKNSN
jgi:hypothetical protein